MFGVPETVEYEDVPALMQTKYIYDGYRPTIPKWQVKHHFFSILTWHNQTINIWTQALAVLAIFLAYIQSTQPVTVVNAVHLISSLIGFSGGVIYHWFGNMNEEYHAFLHAVDVYGFSFPLFICNSWIAYKFTDPNVITFGIISEAEDRVNYLAIIHIAIQAICWIIWTTKFLTVSHTPENYLKSGPPYAMRLVGKTKFLFAICALYPWIIFATSSMEVPIEYQCGMVFFFLACFFYFTRFPECVFPGAVSHMFTSHNLWHVTGAVHLYICMSMCEKEHHHDISHAHQEI